MLLVLISVALNGNYLCVCVSLSFSAFNAWTTECFMETQNGFVISESFTWDGHKHVTGFFEEFWVWGSFQVETDSVSLCILAMSHDLRLKCTRCRLCLICSASIHDHAGVFPLEACWLVFTSTMKIMWRDSLQGIRFTSTCQQYADFLCSLVRKFSIL